MAILFDPPGESLGGFSFGSYSQVALYTWHVIIGEHQVEVGDLWFVNELRFLIIGFHEPDFRGDIDANALCLDPGFAFATRIGFITEGCTYKLLARV